MNRFITVSLFPLSHRSITSISPASMHAIKRSCMFVSTVCTSKSRYEARYCENGRRRDRESLRMLWVFRLSRASRQYLIGEIRNLESFLSCRLGNDYSLNNMHNSGTPLPLMHSIGFYPAIRPTSSAPPPSSPKGSSQHSV
jgi:hypothetical protein